MDDFQDESPDIWTVDRVVDELCHNRDSTWMQHANLKPLDHQEIIEQILRDNDIDGETLLDLREENLKNDLEIKSFGQRNRLAKIINYLRRCSGRQSFSSFAPQTSRMPSTNSFDNGHGPDSHIGHLNGYVKSSASKYEQPQFSREQSTNLSLTRTNPLKREAENAADGGLLNDLETHVEHQLGGQERRTNLLQNTQRTTLGKEYVDSGPAKRRRVVPENIGGVRSNNPDSTNSVALFFSQNSEDRQTTSSESVIYREKAVKSTRDLMDTSGSESVGEEFDEVVEFPVNTDEEIQSELAEFPRLRRLLADHPPDRDSDEDRVLPVYGDSDEEDRYVTEGSISDHEELPATSVAPTEPHRLSKPEIDVVIDQAVAEVKETDRIYKLAKYQKIAHDQWKTVQDYPAERSRLLKNVTYHLAQLVKRVEKLRDHIHDCIWTTVAEVRQQCETLYPTIEQIQEASYVLKALQGTEEPALPQASNMMKQKRRSKKALPGGDESCNSDDDNDGLDAFVVSDANSESVEEAGNESEVDLLIPEEYEWRSDSNDPINHTSNDLPIRRGSGNQTGSPSKDDVPALTSSNILPVKSQELISKPIGSQSFEEDSVQRAAGRALPTAMEIDEVQPSEDIGIYRQPVTPSHKTGLKTSFVDTDADDEGDQIKGISSAKRSASAKRRALQDSIKRNPIKMPDFTESDDDGLSDGSDFDRSTRLPATSLRKHGRTSIRPIDLTQSSPPSLSETQTNSGICTPKLNAIDVDESRSIKGKIRDTSHNIPNLILVPKTMPDFKAVRNSNIRTISDPRVALAKRVYATEKDYAHFLLGYVKSLDSREATRVIKNVVSFLNSEGEELAILQVSKKDHEVAKMLTALFIIYTCTGELEDTEDLFDFEDVEDASQAMLNIAYESLDMVSDFRVLVIDLLTYRISLFTSASPSKLNTAAVEFEIIDDTETALDTGTDADPIDENLNRARSHDSTSRKLTSQPTSAQNYQTLAKHRVRDQARRKEMLARMLEGATTDDGTAVVPVNFKEPLVYLDPHIARTVKPHQIDGIQFMWRELLEDPKQQGCLLAHTMGLGKTMQVISVLVAISQCNNSENPDLRLHIPQHLRQLRILILCPVSLVNNWYDELILWMPKHDTLGGICKIDQKCRQPYDDIRAWAELGGVLIVPYTKLTSYCKPATIKSGRSREQNAEMAQWLLNSPSIVVADEAHALKNPESLKTITAMRIKTKSRIALTGSPLSNHLEEYWGLINFVAPGYLGRLRMFQSKFADPINRSLTIDSMPFERRVGMKKMHILKKILDPKVHRADITAIRSDLPDKTEFYITLPLTELQKRAYEIYVQHFKDAIRTHNAGGRVLTWISILSLLLNHPYCFVRKLEQAQAQSQGSSSMQAGGLSRKNTRRDADEDGVLSAEIDTPDDVDVSNDVEVMKVMNAAIQVFRDHAKPLTLEDPGLSNRSLVVQSIVEETMRVGEKILIFSHSLPTLDYLEIMLSRIGCKYDRIDGTREAARRQQQVKDFNEGAQGVIAFLISTKAGGLGLNVYGATRVVIYDYGWNPSWEEQAIGRAYRLGQKKSVFVYRFKTGGTYEDVTFNSTVFKAQLFSRIVDHKTFSRKGAKVSDAAKYLFEPTDPEKLDLSESRGKDPEVLDRVLERHDCIRAIDLTETFKQDIDEKLTEQEMQDADRELELERLQRENPEEYQRQRLAMEAARSAAVGPGATVNNGNHDSLKYAQLQAALKGISPPKFVEASRQGSLTEVPNNSMISRAGTGQEREHNEKYHHQKPLSEEYVKEFFGMDMDVEGCKTQ